MTMRRYAWGVCVVLGVAFLSPGGYAAEQLFEYNDHGRRDPFWRLVSPSGAILSYDKDISVSDMILEGIIYEPDGMALAIINGEIVKKNDSIGLYVISEIEQSRVILNRGQERFVLTMKKEE